MAFLAPAKRGKSFLLQFISENLAKSGYKVLHINLEMTETKLFERYLKSFFNYRREEQEIYLPYFTKNDDNVTTIKLHKKILKQSERFNRKKNRLRLAREFQGRGEIYLVSDFSQNWTVPFIRELAKSRLEEHGLDAIVIDYADMLVDQTKNDYRISVDRIWRSLRQLSLELNTLIVTASHSNRETYHRDITEADWAEASSKANHLTHAIAINERKIEDKAVVFALERFMSRDNGRLFDKLICIPNLASARPVIDTEFEHNIELDNLKRQEVKKHDKRKRKHEDIDD